MLSVKTPPKLVWDNILTLPYYQPGKPIEEVERELGIKGVVKLASNENPLGPSPKALEAMQRMVGTLNRYPDANGFYLKRKLAERLGVEQELIGLGNGSDELVTITCWAFVYRGEEVVLPAPSFVRYETAVQMAQGVPIRVPLKDWTLDLDAMASRITDSTKLIFVCNPNNPTGTSVGRKALERFMARVPEHIVVVFDEAYKEYVDDPEYPESLEYLRAGRRVLILRTFSKMYGLAGLRIGYGVAAPELANVLRLVRPPFNTSSVAQAAAIAALDDDAHVERSRRANAEGKRFLGEAFDRLGLPWVPTQTNFIFFNAQRDGMALFNGLLKQGVIIRPLTIDGSKNYLRVTIGTMEENRRFVEALERVLAAGSPS